MEAVTDVNPVMTLEVCSIHVGADFSVDVAWKAIDIGTKR